MFSLNPMQYIRNYKLKKLVERTWENTKHTPDVGDIEQQWRQPVFVCDDYMRNRPLYCEWGLIKEYAQYRGRAFTEALFNGYWVFSERRAIFLPNSREQLQPDWSDQTSAHPVSVLGEILLLPSEVLKELDKLMLNGYAFIRTTVTVKIWCAKRMWTPYGQSEETAGQNIRTPLIPKRVEAWMYVANPKRWIPDNGYDYKPLMIYRTYNGVQPDRFVFHSLRRIPRQP